MGFFSKNDTPEAAPNKSKRLECWDARDKFFDCLTENKIENSLDLQEKQKVEKQCGTQRMEFKNKCVASWFKYFQEKRYGDILKERRIKELEAEGAQPLPFNLGR